MRGPPRGRGSALREPAVDVAQDPLARLATLLARAHLAELGGREIAEARFDLACRELVVGGDWATGGDAGASAQAIGLGQRGIGGIARDTRRSAGAGGRSATGRPGAGVDLPLGLGEQALELLYQLVAVASAAGEEVGDELVGVVARDAPAPHRVVDDVLESVAREGDAALEGVTERLDALVGASGRCGRRTSARAASLRRRALRGRARCAAARSRPRT